MPLKKYGFTLAKKYISLPVIIGALFFGTMHLMLLTTGMNIFMVGAVFVSTCVLGLIAGYYREKTASLIPAIVAHMIFNIVGTVLSMLG
jgi:membrane protease YdiL (CAAX protease family)